MTPQTARSRKKPSKVPPRTMVRNVLIITGASVALGLLSPLFMRFFNRQFGVDLPPREETSEPVEAPQDTLRAEPFLPGTPELVMDEPLRWDARWPVSACSVYVTADSPPVLDTIPSAETPGFIPTETQFLLESWGRASGLDESQLERLWAFNRYDTLYVDMPRALDLGGLKRTIEERFVCYTLLIPLVNGNPMESAGSGIPLSGVPGVFPRR